MCPSSITNKPRRFIQVNNEVNFLRHERQLDSINDATNTTAPFTASSDDFTEDYDSFWDYEDTVIDISDAASSAISCESSIENEHRVSNFKTSFHSSLEGDMFLYLSDPNNRFMNYLLENDHDDDDDSDDDDDENENESKREENNGGLDVLDSKNSGALKTKSISTVRRKRLSTEAHPDMILFHLLEAENFCIIE